MATLGLLQWLGLGVLVAYALWLPVFFGRLRPWLMAAVGRRLRVEVEEELGGEGAGLYETVGHKASLGSQGLVWLADLAVLLVGTVGVAALVFVPAFLVAESGVLLPLEAKLTGRRVMFDLPGAVSMRASQGTSTPIVAVRNDGRAPESQCLLSVTEYEARNGYLAGSSAPFNLAASAHLEVELPLRAVRPPMGTHAFRVKLECDQRLLLVQRSTLRVGP